MEKSVYQPLVIPQATVSPDSPASPTSPAPLPYTTPSQHNNNSSISSKAQLAIVRRSSEPTNWAKRLEKNQEGHAAIVDDLRNKVARYREWYDKFKGKTASILTGVANGLAGGATSGTIAPRGFTLHRFMFTYLVSFFCLDYVEIYTTLTNQTRSQSSPGQCRWHLERPERERGQRINALANSKILSVY